jgi:hypothetical protein
MQDRTAGTARPDTARVGESKPVNPDLTITKFRSAGFGLASESVTVYSRKRYPTFYAPQEQPLPQLSTGLHRNTIGALTKVVFTT